MPSAPIRETDDEARTLARDILAAARFAAIATTHPDTGRPHVTRIALCLCDGRLLALISDLSTHAKALIQAPDCSLLIGEPGPRGDPLTHPRLTLAARAVFLPDKSDRANYLAAIPKAKLYIDFGDFRFVRFDIGAVDLNGGFGRAYRLKPADLFPG